MGKKSNVTNLVTKDLVYEYTKMVARHAYNFANGRINPTIKAKYLKFSLERDIDIGINRTVMGSSIPGGVIFINIDSLKEINSCRIRNGLTGLDEEKALGLIVGVVFHELSHCEQNIKLLTQNREEKTQPEIIFEKADDVMNGKEIVLDDNLRMEIANELHTVWWIEENRKEIEKEFTGIDIDYYYEYSTYLTLNNHLKNPLTINEYHPYTSYYTVLLNLISSVMGIEDIEKFIKLCNKQGITKFRMNHDINKEYGGKNRYNTYELGNITILKESEWVCSAIIDMILDEIVLPRPSFISAYTREKNVLVFQVISRNGKKIYGNRSFPDNITTIFEVIRVAPKWFTEKMMKTLEPGVFQMDY